MAKVKALAISLNGAEEITAAEIKEIISATNIKTISQGVLFDAEPMDLCHLCYTAQSVSRIIQVFFSGNFSDFDDLLIKCKNQIAALPVSKYLAEGSPFSVECKRTGNHPFNSQDIEIQCGLILKQQGYAFDYKHHDAVFFIYILDNTYFFGIDYAGIELDKREYRIFNHPAEIKGPLAYALVRLSGYKKKETLIDPFCLSGTILIEAAMSVSRFPVNYYRKDSLSFQRFPQFKNINFELWFAAIDKKIKIKRLQLFGYSPSLRDIVSSRKNAKIAGIDKTLSFSKVDAEWLDLKFKKHMVDACVTILPHLKFDEKKAEKLTKEFFYQAEYVLKPKGRIVVISRDDALLKKYCDEFGFKTINRVSIWSGKQEHFIFLIKKQ